MTPRRGERSREPPHAREREEQSATKRAASPGWAAWRSPAHSRARLQSPARFGSPTSLSARGPRPTGETTPRREVQPQIAAPPAEAQVAMPTAARAVSRQPAEADEHRGATEEEERRAGEDERSRPEPEQRESAERARQQRANAAGERDGNVDADGNTSPWHSPARARISPLRARSPQAAASPGRQPDRVREAQPRVSNATAQQAAARAPTARPTGGPARTIPAVLALPANGSGHSRMPWAQWAPLHGNARQRARAAQPRATGGTVLLIGKPWQAPHGYTPKVHYLRGDAEEAQRRLVEALRIAPAVSQRTWCFLLDVSQERLAQMPEPLRTMRQLDSVCCLNGHNTLAAWRRAIHALSKLMTREEGYVPRACMHVDVSASTLRALLEERAEQSDEVARMAMARAKEKGDARAIARARDPKEEEGGATASLLGHCASLASALGLRWNCGHASLDQYRKRAPPRDQGQAITPDIGTIVRYELIAADPDGCGTVASECAAMAANNAHLCIRKALGARSDPSEDAPSDMIVATKGMDHKKNKWSRRGAPAQSSRFGFSGSDVWAVKARRVTSEESFASKFRCQLRAHNGKDGRLAGATCLLDRPPTDQEFINTLRDLEALQPRAPARKGTSTRSSSNAGERWPKGGLHDITTHSLKRVKPTMYGALRLHPDYLPEAGAHAGSHLERMTVGAAVRQMRSIRPAGLQVAFGYARDGIAAGVCEVDHSAYRLLRAFVAQANAVDLGPGSWEKLTKWAVGNGPSKAATASMIPMVSPQGPSPSMHEVSDESGDEIEDEE
jgi:hypothetical protein